MARRARPFTEYPPRFFEALESFFSSTEEVSFTLSARDAYSTRNRFYDLFHAIRAEQRQRPTDRYLCGLMNLARDLMLVIRPASARGDEEVRLIIKLHPLSKLNESGGLGIFDADSEITNKEPKSTNEKPDSPLEKGSVEAIEEYFLKNKKEKKSGKP